MFELGEEPALSGRRTSRWASFFEGTRPESGEAIFAAIREGDLELLKKLAPHQHSFPWGRSKSVALHRAAQCASPETVSILLDLGAEVDPTDVKGRTPLHLVCSPYTDEFTFNSTRSREVDTERDAVVELLLAREANPAAQAHSGATPLHFASAHASPSCVRALICRGANVNAKTSNGHTPLHWASEHNRVDQIPVLLEAGADLKARAGDRTAVNLALERDAEDAVRLLLHLGCEANPEFVRDTRQQKRPFSGSGADTCKRAHHEQALPPETESVKRLTTSFSEFLAQLPLASEPV